MTKETQMTRFKVSKEVYEWFLEFLDNAGARRKPLNISKSQGWSGYCVPGRDYTQLCLSSDTEYWFVYGIPKEIKNWVEQLKVRPIQDLLPGIKEI